MSCEPKTIDNQHREILILPKKYTWEGSTDEIRRGNRAVKLHFFCQSLLWYNSGKPRKRIRQLHHDLNKHKYNPQTTSHAYSFGMTFSEHINILASSIV